MTCDDRTRCARADLVGTLRAAGCVFAEQEAGLLLETAESDDALATLVRRRVAGEPLEHLLGWVDFCGLRIAVTGGVFVPRRRSELLVRCAAERIGPGAVVCDLCCGCGALGAALLAHVPDIELHAVDLDPAAVRCAERNVGGRGHVHHGDLDAPLPPSLRGRVDLIVANVPYVPTERIASMPPEARDHEARTALDGGADGLTVLRRLAAAAPSWLRVGGYLVVECGTGQINAAADVFAAHGMRPQVVTDDDLDATALVGRADGILVQ